MGLDEAKQDVEFLRQFADDIVLDQLLRGHFVVLGVHSQILRLIQTESRKILQNDSHETSTSNDKSLKQFMGYLLTSYVQGVGRLERLWGFSYLDRLGLRRRKQHRLTRW
jgi:hypothetical protein